MSYFEQPPCWGKAPGIGNHVLGPERDPRPRIAMRPKTYRKARYASSIDCLLSSSTHEFKLLFRMSQHEFLRLVQRFGHDIIFQAPSKREQAIPKYQLALFIYRLGTRNALYRAYLASQIRFPSAMRPADLEAAGTVERWTDNSIQAIIRQLSSHVRWRYGQRALRPHQVS